MSVNQCSLDITLKVTLMKIVLIPQSPVRSDWVEEYMGDEEVEEMCRE